MPSITETSQPQRSWQDRGIHTTPSHSAGWGKRPRQQGHAASRPPYLGAPSPSRWGGDMSHTPWPVSVTLLRRTGPGKPAQLTGGSFPMTDELRATVWAPLGLAAAPPASVPPTPPWTSPRLGQDQAGSRLRLVLGSAEVAVGVTSGIILGGEGGDRERDHPWGAGSGRGLHPTRPGSACLRPPLGLTRPHVAWCKRDRAVRARAASRVRAALGRRSLQREPLSSPHPAAPPPERGARALDTERHGVTEAQAGSRVPRAGSGRALPGPGAVIREQSPPAS